jgi:hypothetical protein
MKHLQYPLYFYILILLSACGGEENPEPVASLFFPCYNEAEDGPIDPARYDGWPDGCRLFLIDEDFSDNSADWLEDNDSRRRYDVTQGVYRMLSKENTNWYYARNYPSLEGVEDFEIEVELRFIDGDPEATSSITWGGEGILDNLWRFGVARGGYMKISRIVDNSTVSELVPYSPISVVNMNSPNVLTIRRVSGTHYFFINQSLVAELDNISLVGTEIGFNVASNSEITWDNLKVIALNQ